MSMFEKVLIERNNTSKEPYGMTWDTNGQFIYFDLDTEDLKNAMEILFAKARTVRPQWEQDKIKLEEEKEAAEAARLKAQQENEVMKAELFMLAEIAYDDGTDTPLPDLPDVDPNDLPTLPPVLSPTTGEETGV